jgi:hypothetical protein
LTPQPQSRLRTFYTADFVYVPVTIVHPGGGFEMREEGRCYRIIDDESSREQGSGKLGALATDTTLPLAMLLSHTRFVPEQYRGLLSPEHFGGTRGLFLLEPYDSNKVPILMIHGLMSSPLTWKELTNELLGDAYVRTHYQIWHYVYPTGQSLFYTAKGLRDSLDALKRAIALAHLPQPKPMVVIGHSMYQLDRTLRFQTGSPERRLERRKSANRSRTESVYTTTDAEIFCQRWIEQHRQPFAETSAPCGL